MLRLKEQKYKNKFVGTLGDLGCFSFYPTKILGAYGDGGFILSKNKKLHEKIKRLRFYGIETMDKKTNSITNITLMKMESIQELTKYNALF